jgi:hypothetical protein
MALFTIATRQFLMIERDGISDDADTDNDEEEDETDDGDEKLADVIERQETFEIFSKLLPKGISFDGDYSIEDTRCFTTIASPQL